MVPSAPSSQGHLIGLWRLAGPHLPSSRTRKRSRGYSCLLGPVSVLKVALLLLIACPLLHGWGMVRIPLASAGVRRGVGHSSRSRISRSSSSSSSSSSVARGGVRRARSSLAFRGGRGGCAGRGQESEGDDVTASGASGLERVQEGMRGGFGLARQRFLSARLGLQGRMALRGSAASGQGIDLTGNQWPDATVAPEDRCFLINGWRWHSRAAVRDLSRFISAAQECAQLVERQGGDSQVAREGCERLYKGYEYLWGFTFKKLHSVEFDLFWPWLRQNSPKDSQPYLNELERERTQIVDMGNRLGGACRKACGGGRKSPGALKEVLSIATELERRQAELTLRQEGFVMPCVAAFVPFKVQKKFNNRVIQSLGLVDSQVLLVAMFDAVRDDAREYAQFKEQIPRVAQALVPTWRRTLYNPRSKYLDLNRRSSAADGARRRRRRSSESARSVGVEGSSGE